MSAVAGQTTKGRNAGLERYTEERHTKISFLNGLVRCLTFGIYTPMWITVTCAEPGSAQAVTSGPDSVAGSSAGDEEVAEALQRAAQMAAGRGKPVLVKF